MADLAITNYEEAVLPKRLQRQITVPTAAAGSNAGGSPPAPVVTTGADDSRGNITFGSGSAPAAGNYVVVTFNTPYDVAPNVHLTPTNGATAQLNPYVTTVTTTAFTIGLGTTAAASQANTVYAANYLVTKN